MAKKFIWKVWLHRNRLTPNVDNDSVASVSTAGKTLTNGDIARDVREDGSELSEETILDVLNRGDRARKRRLLEGFGVQTAVVHMEPAVLGTWIGEHPQYSENEHKITVHAAPTAEMRNALADVGVEVLGSKPDGGAYISLVTDVTTGKTDGSVTPGGLILVTGDKIKIDPADEPGTGIFLEIEGGDAMHLPGPYARNTPKEIIALLPQAPDGTYTLYAVTRYAGGGKLLNEPRKILYATAIRIGISS